MGFFHGSIIISLMIILTIFLCHIRKVLMGVMPQFINSEQNTAASYKVRMTQLLINGRKIQHALLTVQIKERLLLLSTLNTCIFKIKSQIRFWGVFLTKLLLASRCHHTILVTQSYVYQGWKREWRRVKEWLWVAGHNKHVSFIQNEKLQIMTNVDLKKNKKTHVFFDRSNFSSSHSSLRWKEIQIFFIFKEQKNFNL